MRKEDKITVNGIQITIKELTVADVRHWMMDMATQEEPKSTEDNIKFVLDQSLFEGIGLSDLIRMTDITRCQIDHFTPSELQVIVQKCKALNPDFFGMRKRVLEAAPRSA